MLDLEKAMKIYLSSKGVTDKINELYPLGADVEPQDFVWVHWNREIQFQNKLLMEMRKLRKKESY